MQANTPVQSQFPYKSTQMKPNIPDDPVFTKYKFYTANPKTKINRKKLIRANSIYDDGTEPKATKQLSKFRASLHDLLNNITLHCYNHIMEIDRPLIEKY